MQEVIIIGAGRYGNGLIGQKYAKDGKYCNAQLKGVIDPSIEKISKKNDFNLRDIPAYDSFEKFPKKEIKNKTIAEIAVIPQIIPELYENILQRGIKNIILPKPVTYDFESFKKMEQLTEKKSAKAVIASNWHYSEITQFTKVLLDKIKGKHPNGKIKKEYAKELNSIKDKFKIEKVELEYSKKHEVLTIDPPSQELPHALQILYSTGLCDLNDLEIKMDKIKQTKSAVNVKFQNVKDIKNGIEINSDLQKGSRAKANRERTVKIYLNDDDPDADIFVDYDAKFKNGICEKCANVRVDIERDRRRVRWSKDIKEDNMNTMYKSMFEYLRGKHNGALTLAKYKPVARMISEIQTRWKNAVEEE